MAGADLWVERAGWKQRATMARMTVEELREVVEEAVERKLTEILGDPDKGRTLRATVERRLTIHLIGHRREVYR